MSALAVPAPVAPAPRAATDSMLGQVLRRLAANLTVACVVPALLLYVVLQLAGVAPAVLSALAWSYAAMAWRRATGRQTSGLLVIAAAILTVRTVFTLSTGNTYVYFLEPIVTDSIVALMFLGSLATARPLVARVAADFYPMTADLKRCPKVARLFQRLTLMWAGVGLLKAGVGFWLLETLDTADFVLVKTSATIAITVLAVVVTVRAAVVVLRRHHPAQASA
ncbi:VC0807 family protein [Nocardioides litoris]|uniref:VC0807 family protein n=1 Tax=Nocardioides litoris TaxID=1926648 RepID=UPI00111FE1C4|nr:VC0807 family protein [Nocardioides litoris]